MEGATAPAWTVRVAGWLVMDPATLETWTVKVEPESARVVAGVV